MIQVTKVEVIANCNVCQTGNFKSSIQDFKDMQIEDVFEIKVGMEGTNSTSTIRLCKTHLEDLRDKIDVGLRKE